jgi:hypothetical protein
MEVRVVLPTTVMVVQGVARMTRLLVVVRRRCLSARCEGDEGDFDDQAAQTTTAVVAASDDGDGSDCAAECPLRSWFRTPAVRAVLYHSQTRARGEEEEEEEGVSH